MTTDSLETWEQWPIGGLVAAAGLNTALWYAGGQLPAEATAALPWITLIAAVASVVAIDGALVATIAGMRLGRYSGWSVASIAVAGLFTMLAALAAHQTLPGLGPWLHGVFALTFVTYAMHLAQPRADVTIGLKLREQEVTRREADLDARLTALDARLTALDAYRQADVNVTVQTLVAPSSEVDDRRSRVKALVDSGMTVKDAASTVGVSRQTASKYVKEAVNG